jgi:hypothetical protein
MIDMEVMRLRRLRNAALRARAFAAVMDSNGSGHHSNGSGHHSVVFRSGLSCWGIARAATGVLRGHPYLSYQQGPGGLRAAYDHINALVSAAIARTRGRTLSVYLQALRRVVRELDDTRALTRSTELSDTLGRAQVKIRRLLRELDVAALVEAGSSGEIAALFNAPAGIRDDVHALVGDWPYLAL